MGEPYYFKCLWNEPNDHFSEGFSLSPIDSCFLQTATIQWKIYRDWEFKFHNGIVELESHPGKRGNNLEYDRLEDELKISLTKLIELPKIFYPKFRPLPNQDDLLSGIFKERIRSKLERKKLIYQSSHLPPKRTLRALFRMREISKIGINFAFRPAGGVAPGWGRIKIKNLTVR